MSGSCYYHGTPEKGDLLTWRCLPMTQDLTSGRDTGISLKCCDGALEPEHMKAYCN